MNATPKKKEKKKKADRAIEVDGPGGRSPKGERLFLFRERVRSLHSAARGVDGEARAL